VAVLPEASRQRFTVSWSGTDASGSGIASYDVYQSVDRGPYARWLKETTQTAAVFTGELDRVYRFFSVARDRVGNVEPMKTEAEASTQVSTPAPGYFAWLAAYFTPAELADPAQEIGGWGLGADPDHDGRANLVEYFEARHPRVPDTSPTLEARLDNTFLRVVFRQAKNLANVEPIFETSADLSHWTTEGLAVEPVADLGFAWLNAASVQIGGEGQRYVRLTLRWTDGP
jgi:hypothetical protein